MKGVGARCRDMYAENNEDFALDLTMLYCMYTLCVS